MFGNENEPVTLQREVEVIIVPVGVQVTLNEGELVHIIQSMGGSFTIYFEGNLFRVSGRDADALGKEPIKPPAMPPGATDEEFESLAWSQMRTVFDPEIPINVVDLGLIYDCQIEKSGDGRRAVNVKMTLTAPGCGMGEVLVEDVRERLEIIPTVSKVDVELLFDPPWNQSMMSESAQLEAGLL